MERPNVKDYYSKIYGYEKDLTKYIDYLEKKLKNQNCTCKDSTGWTQMPCCNICGKQVEGK